MTWDRRGVWQFAQCSEHAGFSGCDPDKHLQGPRSTREKYLLWKLRLTLARTFCFDHVLYTWSPFGLNIRPWSEIRWVWWQNRPPCDRLIASSQCFYVSFCLTFATCVGAKQYTARMPAPRCQKNKLYSPIQLFCAWPSNRLLTFISQNWPCRVARSIALTDGIVLHRRAGIWESFAEGVVEPSWDL